MKYQEFERVSDLAQVVIFILSPISSNVQNKTDKINKFINFLIKINKKNYSNFYFHRRNQCKN